MYVTVERYVGRGDLLARLAQQVRDELLPLIRQCPGFNEYSAFGSDDGDWLSVAIFDDQKSAYEAAQRGRQWLASTRAVPRPKPPLVLAGHARPELSYAAAGKSDPEALYAVIRQYDRVQSIARLSAFAQEHVSPLLRRALGLRCHYVFFTDDGRVIAASIFEGREDALLVHAEVVRIMRERAAELVLTPPHLTAGRVILAAAASEGSDSAS